MTRIAFLLFSFLAGAAGAADLRAFDAGSPAAIRQAEAGKPYILAFWSLTCEPCRAEMKLLKAAQQRHRGLRVHLVSVDPPEDAQAMEAFLRRYDPGPAVRWVFSDAFSERVRHAVDPGWRGELPRTYLVGRDQRVQAVSGTLKEGDLKRWLAAQRRAAGSG